MQSFKYQISPAVFENTLHDIMGREGGDWGAITSVKNEMAKRKTGSIYERFMAVCRQHHIVLVAQVVETNGRTHHQLEIHKDGRCWYQAELKGPHEDITEQVATQLYNVLGVSLKNKKFIEATQKANERDA